MMDAKILGELDHTVRCLDYVAEYPDKKTWLTYWRASPAPLLNDIDGFDLTGYRTSPDGVVWQISVSVPDEIARSSADRGHDMYWGYRLEPIDGGTRTKLSLVCQTRLNNWIPKIFANMKVGQVLAHYVRTAERKAIQLTKDRLDTALLKKFGIPPSPRSGTDGGGNKKGASEQGTMQNNDKKEL